MYKKVVNIILIIIILFGNCFSFIPQQVFAQEESSTVSADITGDIAPSPTEPFDVPSPADIPNQPTPTPSAGSDSNNNIPEVADNYFENVDPSPTPLDLDEDTSGDSAAFGNPMKVHNLSRRNYKGDEKITVIAENTVVSDMKVKLFDVSGNEVPVMIENINTESPAVFRIIPPVQFKAGRYRLVIEDSEGNVTTQNFTWGVLAINTNKSIYVSNETANIAIAVLDETGIMVCDASVELKIANQELGIDDILSTENGKIKVNPECSVKDYTEKPDYEAAYEIKNAGYYSMTLTAETDNGAYTITDGFDVKETIAFDVERINATRIFPPVTYSSIFNITANEDFRGTITETVPDTFAILPTNGAIYADEISSISGKLLAQSIADNEVPHLAVPFENDRPISQKFGQELGDPVEGKKYKDYGVVGHDGVDFDMPEGTAVLASDEGVVALTSTNGDYGQTVALLHSWGKSYYGHLSEITVQVGQRIRKGQPIAVSGSSGLSTGPHLHFGIKPFKNDADNGYYGKINPLPYLGYASVASSNGQNKVFFSDKDTGYSVRILTWNVSLKKGDKVKLGYGYRVPNISPQFYLLGPVQFKTEANEVVFQEQRQWQLAIDADGSGTNVVAPDIGQTSEPGKTYTFTFTPTEQMDSGAVRITVPAGWSAPQGSAGTAGYTTATGNNGGVVAAPATELTMEATSGWIEESGQTDPCNTTALPALDATNYKQGSNSIRCNNSTSTLPDSGDTWGYLYGSAQDWSAYTRFGVWFRTSVLINSTSFAAIGFYTSNLNTLATGGSFNVYTLNGSANIAANTWVWLSGSLSGTTRTAITGWGIQSTANTPGTDSKIIYLDDFLLGPGAPTFSGTGPWNIAVRMLDLNSASSETVSVTYGSGGGTSGVRNSDTAGVHTFTTASMVSPTGSYTNIGTSPTITLGGQSQLMRHGAWFNPSGAEQPFLF